MTLRPERRNTGRSLKALPLFSIQGDVQIGEMIKPTLARMRTTWVAILVLPLRQRTFSQKNAISVMLGTDLPTVHSSALRRKSTSLRPTATTPIRDVVQRPPNDVIIIEYLANVDKLPEAGALIIAAPINFVDGVQGTACILGILPSR